MSVLVAVALWKWRWLHFVRTNETGIMRWMAVDVDLDHKNDDSHVIGWWSIVV